VRKLGYGTEGTRGTHRTHGPYGTHATSASYIEQSDPETAANAIICLIHQANYLLDQQLRALEAAFVKEGGLRERMTRARLEQRKKKAMP